MRSFATKIKSKIEDFTAASIDNTHRNHMGASSMGSECERYLWLVFRWALTSVYVDYKTGEDVTGRMLRLFNRGHREEPELVKYLRGIGFQIWEHDPTAPLKDGKPQQFRVVGSQGHFGGSLDGMAYNPEIFPVPLLLEMKTYNKKRFDKLKKEYEATGSLFGVRASDFKYAVQCDIYGFAYNLQYSLFVATCKDDDEILVEIIKLNWIQGKLYTEKADKLIFQKHAPPKIAFSEANFKCKYCNMVPICHRGEPVEINCRSCINASPVANAQWHCNYHNAIIPSEVILKGCDKHESVVD